MKKLALDTEATGIKIGFLIAMIVVIKESGGDVRKCYGEKVIGCYGESISSQNPMLKA